MVGRRSAYQKIIVVACLVLLAFVQACGASRGAARPRAKRHFLAWESANAHDSLRPWRKTKRPEREYDVRARRSTRMKKPSFWNTKPVQFSTQFILYRRDDFPAALFVDSHQLLPMPMLCQPDDPLFKSCRPSFILYQVVNLDIV